MKGPKIKSARRGYTFRMPYSPTNGLPRWYVDSESDAEAYLVPDTVNPPSDAGNVELPQDGGAHTVSLLKDTVHWYLGASRMEDRPETDLPYLSPGGRQAQLGQGELWVLHLGSWVWW